MIPFEKIKQSPLVKQFIENRFDNKNVLVYAEGGFGKTTAMRCLQAYLLDLPQKEKIVPLYIDVKKIDQFSNKPLIHYIYTEYSGSDTKESDVENLFTDQAPSIQYKYKYYILIDGYNEVPVLARFNINSEISNFAQRENVRIILSSRLNEQVDIFKGFKRISLLGLNDAQIKLYLKKQFQTDFDLEKVNQSLVNILRSPLYMSAFSKTYGRKKPFSELFSDKEVRKGDILDNFIFHSLDKLRPNESSNDLLAEFILLYFMPALAFRMYKNESFTITKKEMEQLVDDIDYFKSLLDIEKQGKYLGEYSRNIYDIEKICCDNIAVLQRTVNGYEMHNIYRDFFAAKQVINFINAGLINELEIDLDENIRQFVGELIREYDETYLYSKDYADIENDDRKCECDYKAKHDCETWKESPTEHFLQRHNLKSATPLSPIATKNLIDIMKISRNGNITANYNYLDLKSVTFYECNLICSTFNNAKVYYENFIPTGHKSSVNCVAYSHDGKYMASAGDDQIIYIWNAETNELVGNPLIGHTGPITSISFSPDDKMIISAGYRGDFSIRIWDVKSRKQLGKSITISYAWERKEISFSPDGKKLIVGTESGEIYIYSVKKRKLLKRHICGRFFSAFSLSPLGDKVVFGTEEGMISICNAENGQKLMPAFRGTATEITALAFSPDGKKIASVSQNGTVSTWDAKTGLRIRELFTEHSVRINSIAFSPDGKKIVGGDDYKTIFVWNAEVGKQMGEALITYSPVKALAFSPDGKKVVSGNIDGKIDVWSVATKNRLGTIQEQFDISIFSIAVSPSFEVIACVCSNGLHIWNFKSNKIINKIYTGYTSKVLSVSFSDDGKKIVTGGADKTIRIWDSKTGQQIGETMVGHEAGVTSVLFLEKEKKVVSCCSIDKTIRFWDVETGKQIGKPLLCHLSGVCSVCLSPNKKRIISTGNDGMVRSWDFKTGKQIENLLIDHAGAVVSQQSDDFDKPFVKYLFEPVSFSSDGKQMLSLSFDGNLCAWDVETGYNICNIESRKAKARCASFLSSGKFIVTGNWNGSLSFWSITTGEQLGKSLTGHASSVTSLALLYDTRLVSSSCDGTLRVWNLKKSSCLDIYQLTSSNVDMCIFKNAKFIYKNKRSLKNILRFNGGIC